MKFRDTFGEAYMKGFDAHLDRQQAAHTDQQDADEAKAQARQAAIEEMVAALVAGKSIRYGTMTLSTSHRVPLTIDASDVRDEIDGNQLREAMTIHGSYWTEKLWKAAARRVCERHVDEYLEWRTTV